MQMCIRDRTTVACAVLAALKKRGADPCAFKSGTDYIDPMFHRSALQVDSHNLDLFLSNRDMVPVSYTHLDVYKRQGSYCLYRNGAGQKAGSHGSPQPPDGADHLL